MSLTSDERHELLLSLMSRYLIGDLTQGQLLHFLRKKVINKSQDEYAQIVKVSRQTIINIEKDNGPFRESVLDKVFKPFGIQRGLIPSSSQVSMELLGISPSA